MFYPYLKEAGLVWMMPIVFLSFCALALCLERGWYWFLQYLHSRKRSRILEKIFEVPLHVGKVLQACAATRDIVALTLREFLLHYENVALEIAERKTRQFAESKVAESRRFLDILSLIASLSGTLGLAGTVVGISITFKSMAQDNSKGIALSLATALYTTVAGIALFLLSYICWFLLQKSSEKLENELELNIQKLKDILEVEQKSKLIFSQLPLENNGMPASSAQLIFPDLPGEGHEVIKDFSALEPSPPISEKSDEELAEEEEEGL